MLTISKNPWFFADLELKLPSKSRIIWIVCYIICSIFVVSGCATVERPVQNADIPARLQALLPADVILLGEQHDNPDHHRIHHQVVETLATQGALAALVIEMATQGNTTTGLAKTASEIEVKSTLIWDDNAWRWGAYAPAIMAAVRAGVVVAGANFPRGQMRQAAATASWDERLDKAALVRQNQLIREGHCDMLPASQITPMTRIQIARDVAMASTVGKASEAAPGKTVVLVAGSVHVDKTLGVPRHLPVTAKAKSVLLQAVSAASHNTDSGFDAVWQTLDAPEKDYCAQMKGSLGK